MEIEAVQWDGRNTDEIQHFAGLDRVLTTEHGRAQVRSYEVWVELRPGFWVWRTRAHQYHVSSDGAFRATFV